MGNAWADRLTRVTAPEGVTTKAVTLIYPYYQCPQFFARQVTLWRAYSPPVLPYVSAIVIDDGSPEPMAIPPNPPFPMRVFRIDVDIPWNWLAARNIGAHHAEDGWLLFTDMDHVVPLWTLHNLIHGGHDPNIVYAFSRREHSGQSVPPHSASFFMTREMFWRIGGYDERLSGVYGTDGLYRKRVFATAQVQVLIDELIRYEFVDDASTVEYERKTPKMAKARADRLASLPQGPPLVLSFPHHEVRS